MSDTLTDVEYYVVSYDSAGGEPTPESVSVKKGESVVITSVRPVKIGMEFVCWKDEDGKFHEGGDTMTPQGDVVLKAVYYSTEDRIDSEYYKLLSWQFDKSDKLHGVLNLFERFFVHAVSMLWTDVFNGMSLSREMSLFDPEFCLTIWGNILSYGRPTVVIDGVAQLIPAELYRKILHARLKLIRSSCTVRDYVEFVTNVYGTELVSVVDGMDMTLSFKFMKESGLSDEQKLLFALFTSEMNRMVVFPTGVKEHSASDGPVFGFLEQVLARNNDGGDVSLLGTRVAVTINNTTATAVVVPIGSKFTQDEIEFTIESTEDTTVAAKSSVSVTFSAAVEKEITNGMAVTVKKSDGTAISGLSSATSSYGWFYQKGFLDAVNGPKQYIVTTVVVMVKNTGKTSVSIEAGSKVVAGDISYASKASVTIDAGEEKEIDFSAKTEAIVPRYSVSKVMKSDGSSYDASIIALNYKASSNSLYIGNLEGSASQKGHTCFIWK